METSKKFARKARERSKGLREFLPYGCGNTPGLGGTSNQSDERLGRALPGMEEPAGGQIPADYVPVALRAFTKKIVMKEVSKGRRHATLKWSRYVLVLDCETTDDAIQKLTFGSYRIYDLYTSRCTQEGIFCEDNLAKTYPEGFAALRAYVEKHRPAVARPNALIRLLSVHDFLEKVLWPHAQLEGLIVGFNLPFDLTRFARGWSEARQRFRGGFSLKYWRYRDKKTGKYRTSRYRPCIRIKQIDSKRSFIRFTQPSRDKDHRSKENFLESRFLDLRMLIFALTNASHSLKSAAKLFGTPHQKSRAEAHGIITEEYIDYNRNDVLVSYELFLKLREEFDRHPIDLDPCKAYSPATVAKAYLKAMGLIPPVEKFSSVSDRIQGFAVTAYYGGRSEAPLRKRIVPVVYSDFSSMYPRVNKLMGLFDVLKSDHLEVVDATDRVRELLSGVSLDRCFE